MIQSVTVTNYLGESLTMGIGTPDKSGVLISNITGVGPEDAVISTTEASLYDGSIYNAARKGERLIGIDAYLCFIPMVEDARHLTYKYFPLKKKVKLKFETDRRTLYIDGYVEANSPSIFEELETTQIQIKCPYPWFRGENEGFFLLNVNSDCFTFPFSNPSLDEKLIFFSERKKRLRSTLVYEGDVETGVVIKIRPTGACGGRLTISNLSRDEKMILDLTRITRLLQTTPGLYLAGIEDSHNDYILDSDRDAILGFASTVTGGGSSGSGSGSGSTVNKDYSIVDSNDEKILDDSGSVVEGSIYKEVVVPGVPDTNDKVDVDSGAGSESAPIVSYTYRELNVDDDKDAFLLDDDYKEITGIYKVAIHDPSYNEALAPVDDDKGVTIHDFNDQDIYGSLGMGLLLGDTLTISTIDGHKYIQLIRGGYKSNVFSIVDRQSDWIKIHRGNNTLDFNVDYGYENMDIEVSYPILYEGI